MRVIVIVALLIAIFASTCAFADTKTWTWNFNEWNNQGWVYQTNGGAGPVGLPSNNPAFNGNSPAAWLPDKNTAHFDITNLPELLNGSNSFVFSSLVGFNYNTSVSELTKAGLAFRLAGATYSGASFWYEGNTATSERMNFGGDSNLINVPASSKTGCFRTYPGNSWSNPANQTVKMYIYYNTPGKEGQVWVGFEGVSYLPYVGGGNAYAEWKVGDAKIDPLTGKYYVANRLRLGGDNSWAQPYFDDINFTAYDAVVPEPSSFVALGTGLIGLLGVIRRRK